MGEAKENATVITIKTRDERDTASSDEESALGSEGKCVAVP